MDLPAADLALMYLDTARNRHALATEQVTIIYSKLEFKRTLHVWCCSGF